MIALTDDPPICLHLITSFYQITWCDSVHMSWKCVCLVVFECVCHTPASSAQRGWLPWRAETGGPTAGTQKSKSPSHSPTMPLMTGSQITVCLHPRHSSSFLYTDGSCGSNVPPPPRLTRFDKIQTHSTVFPFPCWIYFPSVFTIWYVSTINDSREKIKT